MTDPPGAEPRVALAQLPTPLEPLDRFSEWLGGPRVLVKRDDQTGLALGGNKARKLEFLAGEARARGCDTLVTGGGPQSNHARMTAAAANRLGLACHLALAGSPAAVPAGNLLLDHVLGAAVEFTGARDYYAIEESIVALAARLEAEGRRPYAIPVGGASVTGALAYVHAGGELSAQTGGTGVDWVVVADGSGGTHAGLLAGLDGVRLLGVDVGTRPDLPERVAELATGAARAAGRPAPRGEVVIDRTRFGDGYGAPTATGREAILTLARLEGIVLDPVYTGKAMAGLIAGAQEGRFTTGEVVVFWHTGGAPALFAPRYARWLTEPPGKATAPGESPGPCR